MQFNTNIFTFFIIFEDRLILKYQICLNLR